MDHSGFATAQGSVYFLRPHCSGSMVLYKGTIPSGPCALCIPRSNTLRFSGSLQGHRPRWAVCFVPFPGSSRSGDWVLGKHTVPGGPCILFTSPVLAPRFPRCAVRAQSQVCHVSPLGSWFQAMILLAYVNAPGSQEDMISNREPAHSLVWDAVSGARLQQPLAFWPWLSYTYLSASRDGGPYMAAGQLFFGICSVLCSVSMPKPFIGNVFGFVFCLSER